MAASYTLWRLECDYSKKKSMQLSKTAELVTMRRVMRLLKSALVAAAVAWCLHRLCML